MGVNSCAIYLSRPPNSRNSPPFSDPLPFTHSLAFSARLEIEQIGGGSFRHFASRFPASSKQAIRAKTRYASNKWASLDDLDSPTGYGSQSIKVR